jgi:hypothetical protein
MDYYIIEWRDIAHFLSRKNPKKTPCWFNPNPVNSIVSIREGRETDKDLKLRRSQIKRSVGQPDLDINNSDTKERRRLNLCLKQKF